MITRTITKNISIKPSKLHDVKNAIIENINTNIVGKCSSTDGYIISAGSDIQILSNKVVVGWVRFKVKFDIVSLLPVVGDVYTGTVIRICEEYFFVNIHGKMKALVTDMGNYTYNASNTTFVNDSGKVIAIDTDIKIKLTGVRYEADDGGNFLIASELEN